MPWPPDAVPEMLLQVVAECLGRLTLLNGELVLPMLHAQLSAESGGHKGVWVEGGRVRVRVRVRVGLGIWLWSG